LDGLAGNVLEGLHANLKSSLSITLSARLAEYSVKKD
jgi:hypothetical protein